MMAAAVAITLFVCSGRSFMQGDPLMAIFMFGFGMCFAAI